MNRIPFSQLLQSASVDIKREYNRLYQLFRLSKHQLNQRTSFSLRDYCAYYFTKIPFRGTCISLDDFDRSYKLHFEQQPSSVDLNYLVTFCEYTYNLILFCGSTGSGDFDALQTANFCRHIEFYIHQVLKVIDIIGYMPNTQNGITDFVPKNQAAISVAEIIDPNLSYKVIEYNHHSMKGDLERKKSVLLILADMLEPKRGKLKEINSKLESDLFYLFNNVNLRHNNGDPQGQYYKPEVAAMKDEKIEQWYDDTYEMCLIAFLELDHEDRKKRIGQLKGKIS